MTITKAQQVQADKQAREDLARIRKAPKNARFCMTCLEELSGRDKFGDQGYSFCCNDRIAGKDEMAELLARQIRN